MEIGCLRASISRDTRFECPHGEAKIVIKREQSQACLGYAERNLYQFRNFYLKFNDLEILNTRIQNLTWSHIVRLLRVENEQERIWYMQEAINEDIFHHKRS